MARIATILVAGFIGIVLVVGSAAILAFAIALEASEGGSLDDPMLGTGVPGIGVLNGWGSLVVLGIAFAVGLIALRVAWRAIRRSTP